MKLLILLMSLTAAPSFANPFDSFIGQYKVEGKIEIRNFKAKGCIRYGIPDLKSIEVKQDSQGYKQSHFIYLFNSMGWNGLPVMQYEDRSEFDPSVLYFARVSGGSNLATNFWGSNSKEHFEDRFSLQRIGDKVVFSFSEEYIENNEVTAGCYYQAILR